jgi:hypothetical protein
MWVKLSGQEGDGVKVQDSGGFCQDCYVFWTHQSLEPKRLVQVFYEDGKPMLTEKKQIPIVVCPYCDGDVILKLHKDQTDQDKHEHNDSDSNSLSESTDESC